MGIYRQFRLEFQDRRIVRNYGCGPRGWRIRAPISASWGPRISAIIAASQQGIQLCKTTISTMNGERFIAFIRDQLVPILNPYNGGNPNSIVSLGMLGQYHYLYQLLLVILNYIHLFTFFIYFLADNHPVHRLAEVRRLIIATGALLRFLPPYCPDLNPVEMVIANAEAAIREQEVLFARSRRPRGLVLLAVLQVTQEFCQASVRHCGYWSQLK